MFWRHACVLYMISLTRTQCFSPCVIDGKTALEISTELMCCYKGEQEAQDLLLWIGRASQKSTQQLRT